MKISTRSRYALEALFYMILHASGTPMRIRDISEGTEISEHYLEQIFYKLRRAGLLDTVRGAKGGFFLCRPPEEVTVFDIVQALETHLVPVPCVNDLAECTSLVRDTCVTRGLWIQIARAAENSMRAFTLSSLVEQWKQKGGIL